MLKILIKRNRQLIILLALILTSSMRSELQAQVTLGAEFRPRTEFQHGFNSPRTTNQEYALFTTQRTRLNLDVKKDRYSFKMVLQDVRTWGSQSQMVTNDGALTTIHESFGVVQLNKSFAVKLGRQEIIYDDHRIFGSVGWAQQARSHDALLVQFKNDKTKADLGFAYNQDRALKKNNFYPVPRSYKTFQNLWINHTFNENLNLSILALNLGQQAGIQDSNASVTYTQTVGGRLGYKNDKFKAFLATYVQTGENTGMTTVNAINYRADLIYKVHAKHAVALAYEVLSGNDFFDGSNEQNAFNPYFGTNHKFNGFMDYFYVGNYNGSAGLSDLVVQYNFTPSDAWNTALYIHQFAADGEVKKDANSAAMDKNLGTEVDFVVNWIGAKDMKVQLGYCQLFGTETLEFLKGGDTSLTNHFLWVMLTLKPHIFTK